MKKQKISAKIAFIGVLASGVVGVTAQSGGGAAGAGGGGTGTGATGVGSVGRTAVGGGAGSSGIVRAPGAQGGGNISTGARAGSGAVNGGVVGGGVVSPGGLTGSSAVSGTESQVGVGAQVGGTGVGSGVNTGIGANRAVGTGTQSPFPAQNSGFGAAATGVGAVGANGVGVAGANSGVGTIGATGTTTPVPFLALPGTVQNALRTQVGNQQLGPVTQVMTPNGPVYTTSVPGPGNTVRQIQVSSTGAVLANNGNIPSSPLGNQALPLPNSGVSVPGDRNPLANQADNPVGLNNRAVGVNGTGVNGLGGNTSGNLNGTIGATGGFVGTTLPTAVVFDDLPENLRNGIREQIGEGNNVTAVTRQMTPNGAAYSVVYDNNGRPSTLTIDANGRPIAAPTGLAANARTNNVESVKVDDLPSAVAAALKAQAPYAEIRFINKETGANGDAYTVGFRAEDRYTEMQIGADGKILHDSRNTPIVTVARAEAAQPENRIAFANAPKVIQDAVKAYAGPADVRSIQLTTTKDGKSAFDVVFVRDGRRDQVILAKDGGVIEYKQNVPPAAEAASAKAPIIAVGDLPQPVQETIRRRTEGVTVRDITTRQIGNETVYQVRYQTNGSPVELFVGRDGAMVYPVGAPAVSETGKATPAPTPREGDNLEVIRKVNVNADKPESSGRPAVSEVVTVPETRSSAALTLADLPVPVQNTIKKMNGTAVIDNIEPRIRDSAVVYEVSFQRDGKTETMLIGKDGVIQKD